jgi:hypothetical protein
LQVKEAVADEKERTQGVIDSLKEDIKEMGLVRDGL